MNQINKKLINHIKKDSTGIPLDKFIEICLFEKNGYYRDIQPIGKTADFITAPEISQLFGEILGLYIYDVWHQHLKCNFNIIEFSKIKGDVYYTYDYSEEFKIVFNERSLGLYLKQKNIEGEFRTGGGPRGDLVQIRRKAIIRAHSFLNFN